jgi:hypothetical protein
MVYLYALLVLSLAAILWAVWAIAKHVRTHTPDHATDEQRSEDSIRAEAGKTIRSSGRF